MTEMETWSTAPLPRGRQFSAWAEKTLSTHMHWELTAPITDRYPARMRHRAAREINIAEVRCAAFSGRHTPAAGSDELVGLQLQVSGQMACTYGREQFTIGPGDLFAWSSDREGTFETYGPHRQISLLVARHRVPSTLLAALDRSRPVAASPGAGVMAIAAAQLRSISRESAHLSEVALARTVDALLEVFDVAVAPPSPAADDPRGRLLEAAQRHALERLDDSQLSVGSIAEALGVSVRSLHLAFAETETTAARWIRGQRLERSHRDLVGASDTTTVTDIAYRWGFNDAAHFSRVFKAAYGVPPSAVLRGGG